MQLYFIDRKDLERSTALYKSHIENRVKENAANGKMAKMKDIGFEFQNDDKGYQDPDYVLLEQVNQGMKKTYKIKAFYWYLTYALEACQLYRNRSSLTGYYVNALVVRDPTQGGKS